MKPPPPALPTPEGPPDDAIYRPEIDDTITYGEVRAQRMILVYDLLREAEESWVAAEQIASVGGDEYLLLLRRMVNDQGLNVRRRNLNGDWQFRLLP